MYNTKILEILNFLAANKIMYLWQSVFFLFLKIIAIDYISWNADILWPVSSQLNYNNKQLLLAVIS